MLNDIRCFRFAGKRWIFWPSIENKGSCSERRSRKKLHQGLTNFFFGTLWADNRESLNDQVRELLQSNLKILWDL